MTALIFSFSDYTLIPAIHIFVSERTTGMGEGEKSEMKAKRIFCLHFLVYVLEGWGGRKERKALR